MNKIALIMVLISGLGLIGCSKDNSKNAELAARHQATAKTYEQQGQLRAAILETRNAIQLMPESADSYMALANIFNKTGAYPSTISMLESIVAAQPQVVGELAEAYLSSKKYRTVLNIIETYPAPENSELKLLQLKQMALANIALGDKSSYQKAVEALRAAGGEEAEAKYIEAKFLLSQGQAETAQDLLQALVDNNEKDFQASLLLGELALYGNDLAMAEKELTKALSLLPKTDIITIDRATVLSQLTEVLIRQGRTSEAYTYQKLLADANPDRNAAQQKFNDAMEYYQQGKFTEAEKLLRELRALYPEDKNTATLLGMIEFQQGSDQNAIDLFDQFIDPETATPTVIQAAALAKFRSNQIEDAVTLLKEAAQSQPNNPAILATYGLALLDQDNTSSEGAIALEKSLALDPNQQRIRIALAKRYLALKQPEQAIAQMQKAFEEQPLDLLVQQTYIKILLDNGDESRVIEIIKDFQNKYPENARGPFLEGWFALMKKNYKSAEVLFEKALSMRDNKEKSLSYAGLAALYNQQGQPHKAIVAWQSIIEQDNKNLNSYRPWLIQMIKMDRADDAIKFLQELTMKSKDWQPSAVLAQLFVSKKEMPEAIEQIEKALEKSDSAENVKILAANIYSAYGSELSKANEFEKAKSYLLKSVALLPNNVNHLAGLIEIEIALKNISEAQKLLDQFERNSDSEAAAIYLQGLIYRASGKLEEGLAEFQKSWEIKPLDLVAEAIYGNYLKANQKSLADEFVIQWQEKLPKSYRPMLILAATAQESGDTTHAIDWYEKVLKLTPKSPIVLNNLAWNYYLDKSPKALETAKLAYELAPNAAPIIDTYGWILVEHGKLEEGIEFLERAASLAEGNEEIERHLQEAKTRLKAR
jgi:cellulose synthase operon protein C